MTAPQGLKFVTGGTVPSPERFSKLSDDIALPAAGMLYMFDLAHSKNAASSLATPWAGGAVPANNTPVPNLCWQQAQAMIGSGTESTLAGLFSYAGISGTANTKGKIERTPKGGIHVILSQAVDLANGNGVALSAAQEGPVDTWLQSNRTHAYYFELWTKTTRLALTTDIWKVDIGAGTLGATYVYCAMAQAAETGPGASALLGGNPPVASTAVQRANLAGQTANITQNTVVVWPWTMGAFGAHNSVNLVSGALNQKWPSEVFYLAAAEDLTVSGRTYAQANAAWQAAYNLAFGPGGRFYGDTIPTAPSTIA